MRGKFEECDITRGSVYETQLKHVNNEKLN